jgi:hypothetical protein
MKGRTAVAVRKGIPHNHVDLPPLISIEATGVCIPIGNSEILLAAVYKSPGLAWINVDITKLLSLRKKCILAGDMNAKHPFWNSRVSNPSGKKLLYLFDLDDFEISAPQCPMHYSPAANEDVLDIVVHRHIRLSNVIVSDILDSDHLPIVFHILDHVRTTKLSEPTEKFTNWERFQSLASDLISPRIEINSGVEADKAARDFTASIASVYRLSTSRITISELNNDLPGLDRLLNYKKRLRKLWQETRDPECKTALNWVLKSIRRLTRKKAPERWETRLANTEETPLAIWPNAKSLINRDGPRAPTAIHGASGLKFYPRDKANTIADCLENLFTPHDLCDKNHEQWVKARVIALLEGKENDALEKIRPRDLLKLISSLKLKKACGIDGVPNECLRHLPRRPLVHLTHLINHCIRLSHFPMPWKEAKVIALLKAGKDPKLPQNLHSISLLSTTGKLFEKVILKIVQRHTENRKLLNANQFGFRTRHSTTLQCMRLADHVTLNFNNKMSMAAVFSDIKKAFDTTWHTVFLYKLAKMEFSVNLIKLISSFLSQRKANCPRLDIWKPGCHKVPSCPPHYTTCIIMIPPKLPTYISLSLRTIHVCMRQTARTATWLGNSNAA